jgi:hypothetical protein
MCWSILDMSTYLSAGCREMSTWTLRNLSMRLLMNCEQSCDYPSFESNSKGINLLINAWHPLLAFAWCSLMSPLLLLLLLLPCRIFEFDCGTGTQEHFYGRAIGFANFFSVVFCVVKIYISMYCLLLVTCNYRLLLYTPPTPAEKGLLQICHTLAQRLDANQICRSHSLFLNAKSPFACVHNYSNQWPSNVIPVFSQVWRTQLCHLCRFDTIM